MVKDVRGCSWGAGLWCLVAGVLLAVPPGCGPGFEPPWAGDSSDQGGPGGLLAAGATTPTGGDVGTGAVPSTGGVSAASGGTVSDGTGGTDVGVGGESPSPPAADAGVGNDTDADAGQVDAGQDEDGGMPTTSMD